MNQELHHIFLELTEELKFWVHFWKIVAEVSFLFFILHLNKLQPSVNTKFRGVFSTAMTALASAIFGHFITIIQGQNPQWKNSINTQHPQYWNPKYAPESCQNSENVKITSDSVFP